MIQKKMGKTLQKTLRVSAPCPQHGLQGPAKLELTSVLVAERWDLGKGATLTLPRGRAQAKVSSFQLPGTED